MVKNKFKLDDFSKKYFLWIAHYRAL